MRAKVGRFSTFLLEKEKKQKIKLNSYPNHLSDFHAVDNVLIGSDCWVKHFMNKYKREQT